MSVSGKIQTVSNIRIVCIVLLGIIGIPLFVVGMFAGVHTLLVAGPGVDGSFFTDFVAPPVSLLILPLIISPFLIPPVFLTIKLAQWRGWYKLYHAIFGGAIFGAIVIVFVGSVNTRSLLVASAVVPSGLIMGAVLGLSIWLSARLIAPELYRQ